MIDKIVTLLFSYRKTFISLCLLLTVGIFFSAIRIKVDAGFEKQLPLDHSYIKTFLEYQDEFGGANRLLIAVSPKEGDIFTPEFFRVFKQVTEESYYIDGVNRAQIRSLFTPNVRFVEIVDGGFAGGNVVPAEFDYSPEDIAQVRENILKSSVIGRLVANDFTSAMVSLQLSEVDPTTNMKVNYLKIADQLETRIREKYETEDIDIQIIGFAKAVGDIADGTRGVLIFLSITVVLVAILVNMFIHSWRMTLMAVGCSLTAVIWNIGIVAMMGYGFDPMSILMPFLVFAIGVSHSLQILNRVNNGLIHGLTTHHSAQLAMRTLIAPGLVALASDTLGFLTIYLIKVRIIQELAIMASMGVLSLIITNLLMLPLLISYLHYSEKHVESLQRHGQARIKIWKVLSAFVSMRMARLSLIAAIALFGTALYYSQDLRIGDLHEGVPELRQDSRYNRDSRFITEKYSIGVDLLNIIVEVPPNSCIQHDIIKYVDNFAWVVSNNPNVQSALSMPLVMKIVAAGWQEGHPKWRELSRNSQILVQAASSVETSTGLLNSDCSVLPIMVFMKDHKAESILSVVETIEDFKKKNQHPNVNIRLATGNVGVMAAANDTVSAAQYPILLWVYGAVTLLCLLLFRSIRATICVILPLMTVSMIAYALMAVMEIGLKISSLPIAALGVGIGVDYGIYIFSQMIGPLRRGDKLYEAYTKTLGINGSAVLVTGLTLSLAVSTWILSDLQFQADMGVLFSSMLFLNMLGALMLLPALCYLLYPKNH